MATTGRPGLDIGTHGSISKRELEPGVWQAATRYRDERGTVRRVRARGRSGAAAERALKRKLGDLQSQVAGDLSATSRVEDLYQVWIAKRREDGTIRPQTIHGYAGDYERYVRPELGQLRLRELTVPRVDRFLTETARVSPRRAKSTRTVLSQMVALAVRFGGCCARGWRCLGGHDDPYARGRGLGARECASLSVVRRHYAWLHR